MRYTYRYIYDWNANLAYFSGLMASDGCLFSDERHLNITSKDFEIIQYVKNITGATAKTTIKLGRYNNALAYNLTFGNVSLYDFLLSSGITPVKSKTIKAVSVPDEFYPDFLRGLFDGDGTTYGYIDPVWKNCHRYYIAFFSASQDFLLWLQKTNKRLGLSSKGGVSKSARVFRLLYGKADSRTLFSAMYYSNHIPKLNRKYIKLNTFISSDPYAKISLNARVSEW